MLILGPKPILLPHQEERLKNCLIYVAKISYGLSKIDIPNIIKEALDRHEIENGFQLENSERPFIDNKPSLQWVKRFIDRNPELSLRMPENLGHQRKYVTEESLRKW